MILSRIMRQSPQRTLVPPPKGTYPPMPKSVWATLGLTIVLEDLGWGLLFLLIVDLVVVFVTEVKQR